MEFSISSDFHDVRLDKFLCKTYQEIPLSGIYKMIRKGNVKVNKKKKKQNYRLQAGDTVRVWEATAPTANKEFLPLSPKDKEFTKRCIVYQNNDILLCNKPAGMVIHAGSNHNHGLTELIISYTQNPDFTFVHRIDKMTSGLVLGTKNVSTARKLSKCIRDHKVEKKYILLVEGIVTEEHFSLNTFLKTEEDRVRSYSDGTDGAKEARSSFKVVQRGKKRTLLEAQLHTGRKHQLRVQMATIGHPIVGDQKYGSKGQTTRMFLLSQSLVVPALSLEFSLPIPKDFNSALSL